MRGSKFFAWVKKFFPGIFISEWVIFWMWRGWGKGAFLKIISIDTFTSSFTWILTSIFRIIFSSTLCSSRKATVVFFFFLTKIRDIKIHNPHPHSNSKCNSKFKILLVEIFCLEQKPNKITATIEKSMFAFPIKQHYFP